MIPHWSVARGTLIDRLLASLPPRRERKDREG